MSQKEFQRVKVIENAAGGRLSVREASRLLQRSERQVQRLKRRYRARFGGLGPARQSRTLPPPRRTPRTPPCAHHHRAEKKNPDASHLQSLRPPGFGGRYLIDKG